MKVLVTGSEGFIGKALCKALEKRRVEVLRVDRLLGMEAKDIGKYLEGGNFDCVFHLAAQTSVFNRNDMQILEDNITTFMEVVKQCNEHHVKLVYASSSTANPCNTTSMYGISKHFDEQYARFYSKNATGVRFHNIYGKNPRQGTLLFHLTQFDKVKLYNNGRNTRQFTYIDDAVEGFIYAYGSGERLVNVANPEKSTIREFAEAVKSHNGVGITLTSEMRKRDNPSQAVDGNIFVVPLSYTPIRQGINAIFAEAEK